MNDISISKDEAVRRAVDAIGLESIDSENVVADPITLSEESVPFLGATLNGRKTLRLEFNSIQLEKITKNSSLRNSHVSDLLVIVDPQSGNPVRIASRWPAKLASIAPYPPVEEVERQLRQGETRYTGIPVDPPKVTLATVLKNAIPWSPEVKQIVAYYVLESTPRYQDKAVWVVELRGFPPLEPPVPPGADLRDIPEDARNHLRNVFDAETGDRLYSETTPQPVPHREGDTNVPVEERY